MFGGGRGGGLFVFNKFTCCLSPKTLSTALLQFFFIPVLSIISWLKKFSSMHTPDKINGSKELKFEVHLPPEVL